MVDFKETAKEIFDICTNIAKADGRATEKIEIILRGIYEKGKEDSSYKKVCNNISHSVSIKRMQELFDEIVMGESSK